MAIEHFEKKEPLDGSLKDFIVSTIDIDPVSKKLAAFCVLQVHYRGGNVYEVVMYDAAHGESHMHRFYKRLDDRGKALSGREVSQETFEECRRDIKRNWRKYRNWYAEKWLNS